MLLVATLIASAHAACTDTAGWTDANNFQCSDWVDDDCYQEKWGADPDNPEWEYDTNQLQAVRDNCPVECNTCPPPSPPPPPLRCVARWCTRLAYCTSRVDRCGGCDHCLGSASQKNASAITKRAVPTTNKKMVRRLQDCQDTPNWKDKYDFVCSEWENDSCYQNNWGDDPTNWDYEYSNDDLEAVRANCPVECNTCDSPAPSSPLPAPSAPAPASPTTGPCEANVCTIFPAHCKYRAFCGGCPDCSGSASKKRFSFLSKKSDEKATAQRALSPN